MAKMTKPVRDFWTLWKTLQRTRYGGLDYPDARREVLFDAVRKWRFDFAWPAAMVAVEIEGGVFVGGGHVRGVHYSGDCEKYNTAQFFGWVVFRITPLMLRCHGAKFTKTGKQKVGTGTNPVDLLEQIARFIASRLDNVSGSGTESATDLPPDLAAAADSILPKCHRGVPPFSLR